MDQQPTGGDVASFPETLTEYRPSPFGDFDDAFSDGDDHEEFPAFSPDVVREVMAKHRETEDEWAGAEIDLNTAHTNGFRDSDTGVSSVDSDRPSLDAQSLSASQSSRSLEDSALPHEFSRVSLSEGPIESQSYEEPPMPYPVVIIDASKPASDRVEVLPERPRSVSFQSEYPPEREEIPAPPHSAPTLAQESSSSTISPSLSVPTQPPTTFKHHRPTRSVGPSTFQKVVSKTRPTFLPPKNRKEDRKHLADWQSMMKQSRVTGKYGWHCPSFNCSHSSSAEKKRKALRERRLAREKKIEESLHIWEKEIIPDWRVVNTKVALRKLWWNGIPSKLRAPMWERAVGNALALSKGRDHHIRLFLLDFIVIIGFN